MTKIQDVVGVIPSLHLYIWNHHEKCRWVAKLGGKLTLVLKKIPQIWGRGLPAYYGSLVRFRGGMKMVGDMWDRELCQDG